MKLFKPLLIKLLSVIFLSFTLLALVNGTTTADDISVEYVDSDYWIPSTAPRQGFVTGQEADIMLSGIDFNNAGGPLLFNHQGVIASDGTRLFLADRNNNRILI